MRIMNFFTVPTCSTLHHNTQSSSSSRLVSSIIIIIAGEMKCLALPFQKIFINMTLYYHKIVLMSESRHTT